MDKTVSHGRYNYTDSRPEFMFKAIAFIFRQSFLNGSAAIKDDAVMMRLVILATIIMTSTSPNLPYTIYLIICLVLTYLAMFIFIFYVVISVKLLDGK
jgi:hypothetical protein